jgi:histidinol dehydrogenase
MRIGKWCDLTEQQRTALLQRPLQSMQQTIQEKVCAIIQQVRTKGDPALFAYTEQFDGVALANLSVSAAEIEQAVAQVPEHIKAAIQFAAANIEKFHQAQQRAAIQVETCPGVVCERQIRAIERVGLYVPGGSAPLVSTVLMLAIPARIAGCKLKVLATPPQKHGHVDAHVIYAAHVCGVDHIYKVGGAQAIAALAYGTQSITKVDKIFGPGNAWVTAAKLQVSQDAAGAALDSPAGPSEVLVIADTTARPEFIAADLLSQAEHGRDSQVLLLCNDSQLIAQVAQVIPQQLQDLPRKAIASEALQHAALIEVATIAEAIAISNQYAPEHLILQVAQARSWMTHIESAGSVFLGHYTPESVGDYASGTNHVLPTYGYAKKYSGLSLADFCKEITFQEVTAQGLAVIGDCVETLATIEGLSAHRDAVRVRRQGKGHV